MDGSENKSAKLDNEPEGHQATTTTVTPTAMATVSMTAMAKLQRAVSARYVLDADKKVRPAVCRITSTEDPNFQSAKSTYLHTVPAASFFH